MFSEMVEDLTSVEERVVKELKIMEETPEDMLKEWLSCLLYLTDTERLLFSDFRVKVKRPSLEGIARGEKMSAKRHRLKRAIKGVTYHNLTMKEEPWGWVATFIVDI